MKQFDENRRKQTFKDPLLPFLPPFLPSIATDRHMLTVQYVRGGSNVKRNRRGICSHYFLNLRSYRCKVISLLITRSVFGGNYVCKIITRKLEANETRIRKTKTLQQCVGIEEPPASFTSFHQSPLTHIYLTFQYVRGERRFKRNRREYLSTTFLLPYFITNLR